MKQTLMLLDKPGLRRKGKDGKESPKPGAKKRGFSQKKGSAAVAAAKQLANKRNLDAARAESIRRRLAGKH